MRAPGLPTSALLFVALCGAWTTHALAQPQAEEAPSVGDPAIGAAATPPPPPGYDVGPEGAPAPAPEPDPLPEEASPQVGGEPTPAPAAGWVPGRGPDAVPESAPAQAPAPPTAPPAPTPLPVPARQPVDWNWPDSDRPIGPDEPHRGFYLRLHLGAAAWRASFAADPGGGGVTIGAGIGGSVTDELVVYGELESMSQDSGSRLQVVMIGVGLTYWLLSPNVYLSAAVGTGQASAGYDGFAGPDARSGLNLKLMVGKEWLVAPTWGIGAAVIVRHGRYDIGTFSAIGLAASTTWH